MYSAAPVHRAPPKVVIWPGGTASSRVDLSADVVAFTASKQLGQPAGTFSITLVPRQGNLTWSALPGGPSNLRLPADVYRQIARPNVPISIGFEEYGGIMLGLTGRVSRTQVRAGRQVRSGITITGLDMGKALVQDAIIRASLNVKSQADFVAKLKAGLKVDDTHPLLVPIYGVFGPKQRDGATTFKAQSIQKVVDWILDTVGTMQVPLLSEVLGGSGKLGDYVKTYRTVYTWNDQRVYADSPKTYQGSTWGFLQSILDPNFYELWIDSLPLGTAEAIPEVVLVVRPKPFDEPDALDFAETSDDTDLGWNDLRTLVDALTDHDIPEEQVLNLDLGLSDAEAFSFYRVIADHELAGNAQQEQVGLSWPLVDTYAGATFGMRQYDGRLTLADSDVSKTAGNDQERASAVAGQVRDFRNRLFNWYRLNPFFETGTIRVFGRDRFRVGDPVKLRWLMPAVGEEKGLRFYCTGVTWSWAHGQHYTSTLQLTRGHNAGVVQAAKDLISQAAPQQSPDHFAETK